jgi:hypothetical protein
MKTAVSIPDELFRRAERLAHRLGKSRSKIYGVALAEYVARRDRDAITVVLDKVVKIGSTPEDWVVTTGRSALERSEWKSARATFAGRRSPRE